MDHYHIWCDLKPGVGDVAFTEALATFLGTLAGDGRIESYTVTRRKLGFGPPALGEFHVTITVRDLAQLDEAFREASARSEPIESIHAAVNQLATNLTTALYRDFPDPNRERGAERF